MRLISRILVAPLFVCLGTLSSSWATGQEPPPTTTPADGRPTRTVKLPAAVDDLAIGGAGKFLIAHLKSVQKLAIIDVKEAKVAKYLPISSDNVLFAAGAEKLYIVLPEQSIIQRWSLTSFEREVAAPLPSGLNAATLTMGHASLGPILVGSTADGYGFTLLNGKTLQPLPTAAAPGGRGFECHASCVVRASANGQIFTSWRLGVSPTGFYVLHAGGSKPETFYEHESLGLLSPSADGTRIYAGGSVHNNKAKRISALDGQRRWESMLLPSVTGDYYMAVSPIAYGRSIDEGKPTTLSIHLAGDARPIVTLSDVVPARPRGGQDYRYKLYPDKRVLYFPELSALAMLNAADDAFDIITLDLDQELAKSGIDYLFVSSRPPVSAEPGKTLDYQIDVKSKQGGVKISLASGPEGMKVSPTGKLTWPIPADQRGEVDVILAIADKSGQEVFQTFRLNLGDAPLPTAATRPAVSPIPPAAPAQPPVESGPAVSADASSAASAKLPPLSPAKLSGDKVTVKLPAAGDKMESGGGGRYLVLHLKSLRKLAIVDLCEAKIAGYIPADDDNVAFAAGAEKLVLVLNDKHVLTRWNLATRERELTVPLEGTMTSVTMGSASAGPVLLMQGTGGRSPGGGSLKFYDLAKLRPLEFATPPNMHFGGQMNIPARASADGRTFCLPGSFGMTTLVFDGQKFTSHNAGPGGSMQYGAGIGVPSPDGQVIYAGAFRYSQQMRPLSKPDGGNPGYFIPAAHGRFYLAVQLYGSQIGVQAASKPKVAVHIEGDGRPLVQLDDFNLSGGDHDAYGHTSIPLDKRIVLVPDAKVIASIVPTFDAIELRKFDLDQALETSGIDYLFVTSRPPASAKPKEAVNYQIAVKSKKGGVIFRLESGPEGMAITPQGLLTWQAPEAPAETQHSIIVAVSDSAGQEVFHTIQLALEGAKPPASALAANIPPTTGPTPPGPPHPGSLEGGLSSGNYPETGAFPQFPRSLAPAASAPAPPYAALVGKTRTWTDASSGRSLEATFVGVESGRVKATREGGIEISIPLDRLSREDLLWLLGVEANKK